eukprot:359077_1
MGCCYCNVNMCCCHCECSDTRNGAAIAKYINERLHEEELNYDIWKKVLLLGPGDSGRSTVFKQLQFEYDGCWSKEDALELKEHIYCQIISQMKCILKHNVILHNDNKLQTAINIVKAHENITILSGEVGNAIKYIWQNNLQTKDIFRIHTSNLKILHASTEYFWNQIDRIMDSEYIPTHKDIINVAYRTTGVIDRKFEIYSHKLHVVDVGGQKSERKKWIPLFNYDVHTVVFMASLSCYDEMMYEDLNKNRMVDSLELFD